MADEHARGIFSYQWAPDSRHLLYSQDELGNEINHVFRIDLVTPDAAAVDLTPFPGVTCLGLDQLRDRPGTAVVLLNRRNPTAFEPYALDIFTGELTLLADNPGHVFIWRADGAGRLFAVAATADGGWEVLQHDAEKGTLRKIATFTADDTLYTLNPFHPTPDGTGIWVGSCRGGDRLRLVRLDVATGEQEVIDEDEEADLDGLIVSERTGELLATRYTRERGVVHVVDPAFAPILEKLSRLSDGDVAALSSDDDERRWIVSFTHDRDPGVTYFYDTETDEARLLYRPYPDLEPAHLAPMQPVTIPSRDGLALRCYLTLPVGIEPTGLPLIIHPHGGPWVRDRWGYNRDVQFLANRGYAVLQVNYRGSTGFGKAFMKAAIGEFAGKMHDDLLDAVEWAVKEEYADPTRVGIYGGSYGGYAALVGVTFTPDVFAAAVDYCGISDLANFIRTLPPYVKNVLATGWHLYVGDPDDPEQEAEMMTRSPITKVDQIRTPLMVVQGANDPRVVKAESDNIVAALEARGVPVEYMVKDDEGHGFANPENLREMFHAIDKFLARHLGGRSQDDGAPAPS